MPEDRDRQAEERSTAQIAAENWKRCIACRQSIPSDATICSYCRTRQTSENRAPYQQTLKWIGAVALVAGLALTISQLIDPLLHHLTAGTETERLIKKARSEKNLRDYPAAIESYEKALRLRPGDRSAMEEETETSMAWVRDFSATGTNEDEIKKTAGGQLAEIFPILDAGLADATGPRKADILAHIAWGHWLNFHIAEAEIGASVEKTLRDALNIDARNVYANAMLANWLLQNREDLAEVKQRFRIAIDTGKQRAFVRDLQIGGMIYDDSPGVRVELIRVANEMRKNGEAIDKENRRRIVSFDYDLYDEAAMTEALSALPPGESRATFLWLDDKLDSSNRTRVFILARLAEISGNKPEALSMYRSLRDPASADPDVAAAIKRLSSPARTKGSP